MPVSMPWGVCRLFRRRAGRSQIMRIHALYEPGNAAARSGKDFEELMERVAAAVARAEALPQDALRQAHPRERSLEDVRLDRPELIVGCWASG